jgi:hypothetical protein
MFEEKSDFEMAGNYQKHNFKIEILNKLTKKHTKKCRHRIRLFVFFNNMLN